MTFPLLVGAIAVVAAAILLVLWQIADRRVRPGFTKKDVETLMQRLDTSDEERRDMQRRIEQLEAIAAEKPLHGGL